MNTASVTATIRPDSYAVQASVGFGMDAPIERQGIDIRKQAIEKVVANARLLSFIKRKTLQQISLCRPGNLYPH